MSNPDYTTAANAILKVLDAYVNQYVPDMMGYRQQALNAMPGVAGAAAKAAVDAIAASKATS
jgi:hypothetical protein